MESRSAVQPGWRPVAWSLAVHGLLLVLLGANLPFWGTASQQPVRLAIEAAVVPDMEAVREREADRRRREAAARRKAEEARRAEAQRQAELARQREAEEARRREAERIALEKRRAAEQRQREAERRRKAEESRKAEAARRAEEQRQAELARQREEQARREAEARQRQAEREAQLRAQLAAEQAREDAVNAGLQQQWMEVIRQHVQRRWNVPPSVRAGLECEIKIVQIQGGVVTNVRFGLCNADPVVKRSIESAVYKASPLPPPPDAVLFDRNITLVFKPTD